MIFFCIFLLYTTLSSSQFNSIIHIKPFACTWTIHRVFCSIYYFNIHKMCLLLLLYVKKMGRRGLFYRFMFLDVVDHPVLNCLWKTFWYRIIDTHTPMCFYMYFLVVLYFNIYSLHLFAFTAFSHTYIHTYA